MSDPLATIVRCVRCNVLDPDPAFVDPPTDPAAREKYIAAVGKYILERDPDDATPLLREGVTPTWFHVRRLSLAWCNEALDDVVKIGARRALAFRAAMHRVECSDGAVMLAEGLDPDQFGVRVAPRAWAQEVSDRFGAETIQEMGQVAIDLARLPKGRRGPFSPWGGTALSS